MNVTAGFDIGTQQSFTKSSKYDTWLSPVVIVQYKPISKVQLGFRGEYYQDEKGVIIASGTPNGFKTFGVSANFDYFIADNIMFRVEARNLNSKDEVFLKNGNLTNQNTFLTTSFAISF